MPPEPPRKHLEHRCLLQLLSIQKDNETPVCIAGAMSNMPAVKVFSLYAAVAVFIDFLFQITWFVALMYLDAKRQESNRLDIVCCVRDKNSTAVYEEGILYQFMEKIYAPALLSAYVRPCVIAFFVGLLFASISMSAKLEVGLDQELALPKVGSFFCLSALQLACLLFCVCLS